MSIASRVRAAEPTPMHGSTARAPHPVLRWVVPLAITAAIAAALLVRAGLTVSTDEATYLGVAEQLADGHGFTEPFGEAGARLERLGPLLPIVLALPAKAGIDPLAAATVLNVVLFVASVLLAAGLAYRLTGFGVAAAVVTGIGVITSRGMLQMHGRVLSEPLYIALELVCVHLLLSAITSGRRRLALGAGVVAAAAVGSRFIGVALVAGGIASLVWLGRGPLRRRIVEATSFAAASAAAVVGWTAFSMVRGTSLGPQTLVPGSVSFRQLRDLASAVSEWVLTFRIPGAVRLAIFVSLTLLAGAWIARRRRPKAAEHDATGVGIRLLAVVAGAHLVVLFATMLFVDANVRFETRLLLPAEVAVLPLLGVLAVRVARSGKARSGRVRVAALLVAAVLALHVGSAAALVEDGMGGGYQSDVWRRSPTVTDISDLRDDARIYSNAPEAIWFLTGRTAHWIPAERDQYSGAVNPAFETQAVRLRDELRSGRAVAVYLYRKSYWHMPTENELRALLGPVPYSIHPDGAIYGTAGQ